MNLFTALSRDEPNWHGFIRHARPGPHRPLTESGAADARRLLDTDERTSSCPACADPVRRTANALSPTPAGRPGDVPLLPWRGDHNICLCSSSPGCRQYRTSGAGTVEREKKIKKRKQGFRGHVSMIHPPHPPPLHLPKTKTHTKDKAGQTNREASDKNNCAPTNTLQ